MARSHSRLLAPVILAVFRVFRVGRSLAAAGLVALTTSSVGWAQTPPQHLNTVSYDIRGTVNANGGPIDTNWGGSDVKVAFGPVDSQVSLDNEFEIEASNATHGTARAEVSVSAMAEWGKLHVGLTSGALTANTNPVTGNPNTLHSASARMNTGKVQARWQDTAVIDAAGDNSLTILIGLLQITGNLDLSFLKPELPNGTYAFTAGSGGDLTVRLFSSNQLIKPYPAGHVGRIKGDTVSGTIINDLPTTFIPVQMIMRDGEIFTIDYMLELLCTAAANLGTNSTAALSTAVYFNADFTHTVSWGGITSATDFATGLPVTDYSLVSASGFDYRYAAPVPEPTSPAMLTLAGAGLLARRRRG